MQLICASWTCLSTVSNTPSPFLLEDGMLLLMLRYSLGRSHNRSHNSSHLMVTWYSMSAIWSCHDPPFKPRIVSQRSVYKFVFFSSFTFVKYSIWRKYSFNISNILKHCGSEIPSRDSPGCPVVKTAHSPSQGTQVHSLIGKLRSHMLWDMAQKKRNKYQAVYKKRESIEERLETNVWKEMRT